MEKVIVTKEVAKGIEHLRSVGKTNGEIVKVIAEYGNFWCSSKCSELNETPLDTVIKALYIGYEVEKTPEEKVAVYYEELRREYEHDAMAAVHSTLNLLGIKIEGVNA